MIPKILWERLVHGKYRKSLKQRLGWDLPKVSGPVIWIHAVSVGETRAVIPLYTLLKKKYPHYSFVVSSTTETGQAEAQRSLKGAAAYFFLPLDFSFLIKKLVKQLRPAHLILVEGEFWLNLVKKVKQQDGQVFLVNGKLSERSAHRFHAVPFLTKALFSHITALCVQNSLYQKRFLEIGIDPLKIHITGNLKLDQTPSTFSSQERKIWKEHLGITDSDTVITLGSTHEGEEEPLLAEIEALRQSVPTLKVILVPRHPERFSAVADLLQRKNISFFCYSKKEQKKGSEQVILIDAMGVLLHCFQLSQIGVVGGSFVPGVGGHNIFEPVALGVPVMFGPYMETQQELVDMVLNAGAGVQCSLSTFSDQLLPLLTHIKTYREACHRLTESVHGSSERTLKVLEANWLPC